MRRISAICVILAGIGAGCGSGDAVAPPACGLDTPYLSFGTVAIGSTTDKAFHITNSGGGTLKGAVTSSNAAFRIVGSTAYSLGPGQSAAITVRFAPTEAVDESGNLSLGTPGCGSVAAFAHVQDARDAFVYVDATGPWVSVLSNIGPVTASGNAIQGDYRCGRGIVFTGRDTLRIYLEGDSVGFPVPSSATGLDVQVNSIADSGLSLRPFFVATRVEDPQPYVARLWPAVLGVDRRDDCSDSAALVLPRESLRPTGSTSIRLDYHYDTNMIQEQLGLRSFFMVFQGWRIPVQTPGQPLYRGRIVQVPKARRRM